MPRLADSRIWFAIALIAGAMPLRALGTSPPPVSLTPNLIELTAVPGAELTNGTEFWNGTSDQVLQLHVEPVDFMPQGEEGSVQLGQNENPIHALAAWIQPTPTDAVAAPGARVPLDFIVKVPNDAQPGSRWAAVRVTSAPVMSSSGDLETVQITANIILRILGDAKEALSIETFTAERLKGGKVVIISTRIRNDGEVHEKPAGTIEVKSIFGRTVAALPLPAKNVLPGTTRNIEAAMKDALPPGRYTVRARRDQPEPRAPACGSRTRGMPPAHATTAAPPTRRPGGAYGVCRHLASAPLRRAPAADSIDERTASR